MSKEKKLIIQYTKLENLREFHFENSFDKFLVLKINLGKKLIVKMLSNSILKICFDHGELILDITSKELENIKYEEL